MSNYIAKEAVISPCGKYRFLLTRRWERQLDGDRVTFIMLNPSTADANDDDPTIRRCVGFAKSWGYRAVEIVNLFAFRATDPKELKALGYTEAVGPDNNSYITGSIFTAHKYICAWSNHGTLMHRSDRLRTAILNSSCANNGHYLKRNGKDGQGEPAHPLYLKGDLVPIHWDLK